MLHQEEYAEPLGEREIQTVGDFNLLGKLMIAREAFLNKFIEEGKELIAFVGPGIVDNKPSIIVIFLDETVQIPLPATFKGYPVLFRYGEVVPASNPRTYHEILKPGISIGNSEVENARILGACFQTRDNRKKFIPTVGHAVGEVCSLVVQPGKYENDPNTSSCAKVTCKFSGINSGSDILDYAFCEIDDCNRVPGVNSNSPLGSETIIPIGELGDSSSAAFDDNGQLWEIYYGFDTPYHFIIPIHIAFNIK
ncbi:hypothetical protein GLOIN_2v1476492 [Rhizophagus clarus]|uniref:Uncharacterized protein n=1 Tax=Rhizophagus clarus TaxID=94130 RepID=A0A8H3QQ25_9GLOM|nr:hypothetical protein GLOIN_2v1476492 [Rhizophagus clarus]